MRGAHFFIRFQTTLQASNGGGDEARRREDDEARAKRLIADDDMPSVKSLHIADKTLFTGGGDDDDELPEFDDDE